MFADIATYLLQQSNPQLFALVVPLIAIGEIGLPIPIFLESVLLFAGYKISQGHPLFIFVVLFTIAGAALGASGLFFASRLFGEKLLPRYKNLEARREKVEKILKRYNRWESVGIAILRLIPGLYIPTTIVSAILEVSFWKFIIGVLLSTLVYSIVFTSLGIIIGRNAHLLAASLYLSFNLVVLAIFVIILVFSFAGLIIFKRMRK